MYLYVRVCLCVCVGIRGCAIVKVRACKGVNVCVRVSMMIVLLLYFQKQNL
jgi:hypothetical protein